MADDTPVIVFGAFDRHNFGDLLFAHVAARLLQPRSVAFAGLADRDLTAWGGHRVRGIANLAREWGDRPADLVHAGGEILTCSLYEAAVMLLGQEEAASVAARLDGDPAGQADWAQARLGLRQPIGYMVPKRLFRRPRRFLYTGVGGVQLGSLPGTARREILTNLGEADHVSVRDRFTLEQLRSYGVQAGLVPDPATLAAELFGPLVAAQGAKGEPLAVRSTFPDGYLAVQFSADFGDDTSLRALATQLDDLAEATGLGMALFRAGAAPWHDSLAVYRRLSGFMTTTRVWHFESLHLWDICALLAGAHAYCGSSLHGRIVAEAFAVPALNLLPESGNPPAKQVAYDATWNDSGLPRWATIPRLQGQLATLIGHDPTTSRVRAGELGRRYRESAAAWLALLT